MARLMEDLAQQDEIAVDTEADSFFSYREKVCLVQITVEDRDYLVDPLADLDMDPLGDILADPQKTKVFHDSEYDVLIMKRNHGFEFAGLFDTRVAAATLGAQAPGLAAVIQAHFGVELDKSQQRSDWAKRPLTDKQIKYARLDTHYLLPLMGRLKEELAASGRTMIVESECRRLEKLDPPEVRFRPDEFVRIKGSRALDPIGRQTLREVFILRERLAEEWDVPPFRVMNNQLLLELAQIQPRAQGRLLSVHGFSQRMARRLASPVLAAIARAKEAGPLDRLPKLPRKDGTVGMSELQIELYERLKRWRKNVAAEREIESSYLLNRHVMARIAMERPIGRDELEEVEGILDWQMEMFGEGLAQVLSDFEGAVKSGEVPRGRPWRR